MIRSSCEDRPCVTGFVAGFAHQVTADAGAEVKAFIAYLNGLKTRRRLTVTSRKLSTPALLPQMPPSRTLPPRLREKEAQDYSKSVAELLVVVDTLQHAISIILDEMAKNPAFCRGKTTRNVNNVVAALHCSSRCGSFSSAASGTATCAHRL